MRCRYLYIKMPPLRDWFHPSKLTFWGWFYIFRNKPGIIPGRWGFGICGFEFGSRNPGDPVGIFLKRIGLWPF